jgi:hypothetical protein
MLIGRSHEKRIMRHFIWASPGSGKIGFLVWLLAEDEDEDATSYVIESNEMQLLPPGLKEDRQIHVSAGGFFSSIPTPDRFALVSLPNGTAVPFSQRMRQVAGKKQMTETDLRELVAGASESIAQLRAQSKEINRR